MELSVQLLSIRSLYVLLVVLLSAWVMGAALRLSAELASRSVPNERGVLDREVQAYITKLREQMAQLEQGRPIDV